jgi:hypothetical protein
MTTRTTPRRQAPMAHSCSSKSQIVAGAKATEASTDKNSVCDNGLPPVGSFDPNGPKGLVTATAYCCPAGTCVAKYTYPGTPGKTGVVPVCLEGTPDDIELCRAWWMALSPTSSCARWAAVGLVPQLTGAFRLPPLHDSICISLCWPGPGCGLSVGKLAAMCAVPLSF